MKTLFLSIVGIFLFFTSIQAQAMVACTYSEVACDNQDNHYQCYIFGWSGDREFCSATDVSPKTQNQPLENVLAKSKGWFEECIDECMKETGQSRNSCSGFHCW